MPYASGTEVNNDGSAEVSIFKALGTPSPELFGQGGAKAPYELKKMPLQNLPGFVETFDPFAEHQWPNKGMQGSFMSNDSDDFVKPLGSA